MSTGIKSKAHFIHAGIYDKVNSTLEDPRIWDTRGVKFSALSAGIWHTYERHPQVYPWCTGDPPNTGFDSYRVGSYFLYHAFRHVSSQMILLVSYIIFRHYTESIVQWSILLTAEGIVQKDRGLAAEKQTWARSIRRQPGRSGRVTTAELPMVVVGVTSFSAAIGMEGPTGAWNSTFRS